MLALELIINQRIGEVSLVKHVNGFFEFETRLTFFRNVRSGSPVTEKGLRLRVEDRLSGDSEPARATIFVLVGVHEVTKRSSRQKVVDMALPKGRIR